MRSIKGDKVELARQLNESPVRSHLLAALDDWATTERDRGKRKRLFAVTAQATGQWWRNMLPDAWNDGTRLAKVYDAIAPQERSPGLIVAVGERLDHLGQDGIRRLEEGSRQYPSDFWIHAMLGLRGGNGQAERQVGAYRAALAIRPGTVSVLSNLGNALRDKKDLDGAVAAYEEAIRLDPTLTAAHHNLGNALRAKKNLDGAVASYREAIRLDPKYVRAHINLGVALSDKKEFALAYRLYWVALADDAMRTDSNQYNAACYALRFAAGDDLAEKPSEKQRSSLRRQAAHWLAVNLTTARKLAASAKPEDRQQATSLLDHWLKDDDLASVRDPKRLEALPPDERRRWEAFWKDVRAARAEAEGKR